MLRKFFYGLWRKTGSGGRTGQIGRLWWFYGGFGYGNISWEYKDENKGHLCLIHWGWDVPYFKRRGWKIRVLPK